MKFKENTEEQAKALYWLLENHEGEWLSQEFICLALPHHFKALIGTYGGTDICRDIWGAVQYINYNLDFNKIVVINKRNYKLANEEEAKEYYKKQREDGLKKLYRAGFVKNKIQKVGQTSLFNGQETFEFVKDETIDLAIEELFDFLTSVIKID